MLNTMVHTAFFVLIVSLNVTAQVRDSSEYKRAQSFEPYIVESAKRYGIDPRTLRVLCYLESGFRLDAISPKGRVDRCNSCPKLPRDIASLIHTTQRQRSTPLLVT